MPDNNPVKSKRDMTMERMKAKYPDRSYDDDEALFGQINDDYDDYDKKLSESQGREKAFSEMFYKNPKAARLMMEWKDGKDPVSTLISIYGKEDILAAIDDPARLEAIEEANKEFAEKVAKSDEYDAQYEKISLKAHKPSTHGSSRMASRMKSSTKHLSRFLKSVPISLSANSPLRQSK